MAVGSFFSAAPTAQNSPELHFCFINYFIQLSRVGSLVFMYRIILFVASISRFSQLLYVHKSEGRYCIKILQIRHKDFCKLCRISNKPFFLKTFQVLIKLIMMFLIHWGYALLCLGICLLIYWYVF